ncbi:hypothetical protein AHF37_03374 [Paragonimus kellicotti]|nr:hypothetical protein AHF37_03374 [Paragonimus kellicotti]
MAYITRYIYCSRSALLHCFPEVVQSCSIQLSSFKAATLKQSDSIVNRKIYSRQKHWPKPISHLHGPTAEPESPHSSICTSSTDDQSVRESDILSDFVMPTNAYGLPRDQLLQKIRSASKKHDDCNWDETGPGRIRFSDSRASADWARFWKQRQDWRMAARRDRRRIRQNTGLYRLTMGHNGVLDIVDEDDSV